MTASPAGGATAVPPGDVVGLLAQATEEARRYQRPELAARLGREQARLDSPAWHVLVVGEFKKGKSTLVNALLNARVCPADVDRATAVPTFVRYGEQPAAATVRAGEDDAAPVAFADIEPLVTGAVGEGTRPESLDVSIPRRLLRDGLVLVDTPGVGGGLSYPHAAATLRALAAADVVLFVSDASQEYTAPEVAFLRQAADLCPVVICALTKIDFYPEWRRILELDQGHLRAAGLDYEILPLSAPIRFHGVRSGDRSLVAESGYPRLAAQLRRAAAGCADTAFAAAGAAAQSVLTQVVAQVSAEHEALLDPSGQDERRRRWADAKRRAEQLKGAGARWQLVLNDQVGELASNVERDLTTRMREVRKEAADRIAADDPTRIWGELQPWLYRRANEALVDHVRYLRDQADAVADEVARQFGTAAWELRVTVDVRGSGEAARDVELAAVAADRSSRLELGLIAARGGSTGAIVTHTVGVIFSLAVPVTLPATALLATILARRTWRSAQRTQLRALRAEADRAVTGYLDEVEVNARKDSRDGLRRVHRQLRDVFSERAGELYAATARNLEALSRSVQEDERSRRARAEQTAAELDRLRSLVDGAEVLLDRLLTREPIG